MKLRKAVWPVLVFVLLIGVLFVAVFPTRTWWAQRAEMRGATEQLQVLEEQNTLLASRVDALQSDDEIERLAREQYNLVKPGEEAYALLPSAGTTPAVTVPPAAEAKSERSLPGKVWHFLTGWL
ncbi:MAG TPA: septum formation initiator family protein [Acidimicrobiales bacterium]|nr:septum formation initiator family protein [Acidimicrobiales bacterium]